MSNEELEGVDYVSLYEFREAFVTWSHNYMRRIEKVMTLKNMEKVASLSNNLYSNKKNDNQGHYVV
jgi:hypothetical protein